MKSNNCLKMNNIAGFGRPANNPGGGQPQGEPTWMDRISQWWSSVPMFNRFIFWTSIIIYLLSFPFLFIAYYTLNIPDMVIKKFELWRLFTAPFSNIQIFMLLFGLLSYMPRAMQLERTKGTTNFIIYFLWLSFISQVLLVLCSFLINLLMPLQSMSLGLWTMVMVDITVDSMKEPEMLQNLCWLPIQLKAKYFPYIYLIIFGLLFMQGFCALLGGFLAGILYSKGMLKFTDPSRTWIDKVNSTVLKPFVQYPSYVKESDALGFSVEAPVQQPMPQPGVPRSNNENRSSQPTNVFSGRGVAVGGSGVNQPSVDRGSQLQYIRGVPIFSPPASQKQNPVKGAEEKTKKPTEEKTKLPIEEEEKEDDLENQNSKSSNSKDEFDDLINLN